MRLQVHGVCAVSTNLKTAYVFTSSCVLPCASCYTSPLSSSCRAVAAGDMPAQGALPNHAPRELLRRIGQFVREYALVGPLLVVLTATKLLPARSTVALGFVFAFLARRTRHLGVRLAQPWQATGHSAVRIERIMRPIIDHLAETTCAAPPRP